MRTLSPDTSPAAERVQLSILARLPAWRKIELIRQMNELLSVLALDGLKETYPGAGAGELCYRLDELRLGAPLAQRLNRTRERRGTLSTGGRAMAGDLAAVISAVIAALDRLGVPYYIGGSIASGVYGVYRATADVDIVTDLRYEHVDPLVNLLERNFYADAEMMRDAIRHHSSFNLLSLETGFKVDMFISKRRPFDEAQFERRVPRPLSALGEAKAYVSSVEGTVLAKLEWYRDGGEVSERQWSDILGVLKVKAAEVDHAYLCHWAAELGLSDLLVRALDDAGAV